MPRGRLHVDGWFEGFEESIARTQKILARLERLLVERFPPPPPHVIRPQVAFAVNSRAMGEAVHAPANVTQQFVNADDKLFELKSIFDDREDLDLIKYDQDLIVDDLERGWRQLPLRDQKGKHPGQKSSNLFVTHQARIEPDLIHGDFVDDFVAGRKESNRSNLYQPRHHHHQLEVEKEADVKKSNLIDETTDIGVKLCPNRETRQGRRTVQALTRRNQPHQRCNNGRTIGFLEEDDRELNGSVRGYLLDPNPDVYRQLDQLLDPCPSETSNSPSLDPVSSADFLGRDYHQQPKANFNFFLCVMPDICPTHTTCPKCLSHHFMKLGCYTPMPNKHRCPIQSSIHFPTPRQHSPLGLGSFWGVRSPKKINRRFQLPAPPWPPILPSIITNAYKGYRVLVL